MKKTKKLLSVVLVLAMVLTLFAGVAQGHDVVRITSSTAIVTPGSDKGMGTITFAPIAAAQNMVVGGGATLVTITLPAGVTWSQEDVTASTTTPVGGVTWVKSSVDAQTATFRATSVTNITDTLTIRPRVDIASDFRGDILASVQIQGENYDATTIDWSDSASVRIGRVAARGTVTTVLDATNVSRGVGDQLVGSIRIRENTADSLNEEEDITISLPAGVTFNAFTTVPAGLSVTGTLSTLIVDVPAATAIQTIEITGVRLNVGPNVPDGAIIATIAGADVTQANVTLATVGVAGVVTVSSRNPVDPVTAGRLGVEVADLRFTENVADALLGNRIVTLTLPVGFTWSEVVVPGSILEASPEVSNSGRTLSYWTATNPAPTTGSHFDFSRIRINTAINAPVGDIVVTVGGTAGVSGTAVLATLRSAVAVTVPAVTNVRADAPGQAVGNIVVTEAFAGALRMGTLTVQLPEGFAFDGTPSVEVSNVIGTEPTISGPVSVDPATRTARVTLNAAVAPTNVASVTFSGIRVNTARALRVLLGPLDVTVGGTAFLQQEGTPPVEPVVVGLARLAGVDVGDAVGSSIATVTAANIVSATARTTVFTVDSTAFTVDGVAQTLEVAPVVTDGRTMMPLRAAANAAGVTNDNILFSNGVITIIRGDRVAQFTLGSTTMVVNGVSFAMDVAPSLVQGRTLIPVRWVATALGVPVVWDAAARTITVTVQ